MVPQAVGLPVDKGRFNIKTVHLCCSPKSGGEHGYKVRGPQDYSAAKAFYVRNRGERESSWIPHIQKLWWTKQNCS